MNTSLNTISQRGQRFSYDAVVIGSGIAGLSYVLELSRLQPNAKIALLSKKNLAESNSTYAQGGIAAAENNSKAIAQHVADTLSAGDELCFEPAVKNILQAGPRSIEYLIQQGVDFDRDAENNFLLAQEGGHSLRRVYHHADHTGRSITQALIQQIKKNPNITVLENHIAINLITQQEQHKPGSTAEVVGVYVLEERLGLIHTLLANVVVLATGGAGKVYRYTTNPEVATGDGVAMAYRSKARVGAMEFYQFHPTVLYNADINNFLISEALRGEGAHLLSPQTGERFMQHYAAEKMELATRDVVARAIANEIEKTGIDYVYLDIRQHNKKFLQQHFPDICKTLQKVGLDLSKDLIPVVPAAHYMCGGVLTNVTGKTDLKRLYAIGETAFTGLHGANRLASNSLLEGSVMGANAAEASQKWLEKPVQYVQSINDWDSASVVDLRRASQISVHWRGLRGEMSSYAGIIRTERGLADQLRLILTRRNMIEEYYWKHCITRDLIELRNIILIAELIVRSALQRKESRGGHYREDYPEKNAVSKHLILQMNHFGMAEFE